MADRITLDVTRYRPEQEAEPTTQRYEAPLRKDWVVLDALNYVKDKVDGTLSFRWSCRGGLGWACPDCSHLSRLAASTQRSTSLEMGHRAEPVDEASSRTHSGDA